MGEEWKIVQNRMMGVNKSIFDYNLNTNSLFLIRPHTVLAAGKRKYILTLLVEEMTACGRASFGQKEVARGTRAVSSFSEPIYGSAAQSSQI